MRHQSQNDNSRASVRPSQTTPRTTTAIRFAALCLLMAVASASGRPDEMTGAMYKFPPHTDPMPWLKRNKHHIEALLRWAKRLNKSIIKESWEDKRLRCRYMVRTIHREGPLGVFWNTVKYNDLCNYRDCKIYGESEQRQRYANKLLNDRWLKSDYYGGKETVTSDNIRALPTGIVPYHNVTMEESSNRRAPCYDVYSGGSYIGRSGDYEYCTRVYRHPFTEAPLELTIQDDRYKKAIATNVRNKGCRKQGILNGCQILSVKSRDGKSPDALTKCSIEEFLQNAYLPITISFLIPYWEPVDRSYINRAYDSSGWASN